MWIQVSPNKDRQPASRISGTAIFARMPKAGMNRRRGVRILLFVRAGFRGSDLQSPPFWNARIAMKLTLGLNFATTYRHIDHSLSIHSGAHMSTPAHEFASALRSFGLRKPWKPQNERGALLVVRY
jgi:hypothetical protein